MTSISTSTSASTSGRAGSSTQGHLVSPRDECISSPASLLVEIPQPELSKICERNCRQPIRFYRAFPSIVLGLSVLTWGVHKSEQKARLQNEMDLLTIDSLIRKLPSLIPPGALPRVGENLLTSILQRLSEAIGRTSNVVEHSYQLSGDIVLVLEGMGYTKTSIEKTIESLLRQGLNATETQGQLTPDRAIRALWSEAAELLVRTCKEVGEERRDGVEERASKRKRTA